MPLYFEFDHENRVIRSRIEGTLNREALVEVNRKLAEYDAVMPARAGILDLSRVTSVDLSSKTMADLAARPPLVTNPERIRCIVAPSAHVFGMSRMFQMLGENTRPNFHVLRSLEEAYALIDLKDPHFEPIQPE